MKQIKKQIELTELDTNKMSETEVKEIKEYNKAAAYEQLKRYLSHPGHKMPVSRRDFLSAGLTSFMGYMSLPTIGAMLAKANIANGAELNCSSAAANAPVIPGILTINPTGGQGIQGIVIPLDKASAMLPSYSTLSMGTRPNTVTAFGALWNSDNPATNTFISQLNTAGIASNSNVLKVVAVNCRTQSDTSNNRNGIEGLAAKAGFNGKLLPGLGRQNSTTGGGFLSAVLNPPAPLVVNNFSSIQNAVSITGALANMNVTQKEAILRTVNRFNDRQVASLGSLNGAADLNNFLQCAGIQNIDINSKATTGIDPGLDANISNIWGINVANKGTEQYILASMAYNTFSGQAGASVLSKGGYDYHGNALANTRAQDVTIMDYAAKAVRTAAQLQRAAVILVRTDGSVDSNNSTAAADWQGDNDNGTHLMILYNPAGVNVTKSHIGAWTTGQGIDLTVGPGDSADLLAKIIMANILKFSGKSAEITGITGLAVNDPNIVVA